jgi:hypothetical protein
MNRFEKVVTAGITKIVPTYHHNEEQLIMESSEQPNYSSTQQKNIDCIERDFTENDLFYLHEKSKANRIDEWQAAWNVTNAIQVSLCISI